MEIITWNITIKQIFSDFFTIFEKEHPELVSKNIKENVGKMLACRDPDKMRLSQYQCLNHTNHIVKVPHSCKSRFCNTCGKIHTDEWISNCNNSFIIYL